MYCVKLHRLISLFEVGLHANCFVVGLYVFYYVALLPRRGPHIVSHSVCLSVRPSVPCLFTLEHRSRVFVNLADVRYLLFCLHARAGPHIVRRSQPHKLVVWSCWRPSRGDWCLVLTWFTCILIMKGSKLQLTFPILYQKQ